MKTQMGMVMDKIGAVSFKKDFTKEEMKIVKMLVKDGIISEFKRGTGKPNLYSLTIKGKMIKELSN